MSQSFVVNVVVPRAPSHLRRCLSTHRHQITASNTAISIAVFERAAKPNRVLLIRRANEPYKDKWSLPGGRVKHGESLRDAALRELKEETSVTSADVTVSREHLETLSFPPYTIYVFAGMLTRSIVPMRGDDAQEARFFDVNEIPNLDRTDGLEHVVERASQSCRDSSFFDVQHLRIKNS